MESSISSKREPPAQQAGEATDGTHDGPRQLPKIAEIALTQNTNSVKLCSRCEWIDFNAIFSEIPRLYDRFHEPAYSLRLGRLKKDASCVLCRFFYTMRYHNSTDQETDDYFLQSYSLESAFKVSAVYFVSHFTDSMVLCVSSNKRGLNHFLLSNTLPPERNWIVPQFLTAAPFFSHAKLGLRALPFSPTLINYPLLRAWCEHCDLHHSTCASATKTKPRSNQQGVGPVVRCIDCRTREVVEIQTSDRFFALSYVWGEQPARGSEYAIDTRGTVSTSGVRHLPDVIPKVIEDAMIVVANLGERYLWVDQYCIDQNDQDDKHAQIGNMAAIYEGAYATIVAFSATDSASGLPGVRNLSRKPCPSVAHSKHHVSALRPSAISSAKLATSSVWLTRGWTYQEAILSRRLLIFTDYQVEFICSNAVWQESTLPQIGDEPRSWIPLPPELNLLFGSENFLEAITPMERSADKIPLRMYVLNKCIEEYSGRRLTHQSDVLNAITGLLSRISTLTYLGIPILEQLELTAILPLRQSATSKQVLSRFLAGLAWCPADKEGIPLRRRDAFPSWSWLGWEGRITFPSLMALHGENLSRYGEPTAHASVWIANQVTHTKCETLVPLVHLLEEAPLGKESTSILPHLTNYLWVEGQVITMTFTNGRGVQRGFSVPKSYHLPICVSSDEATISFRNCSPHRLSQGTVHQHVMTKQWDCLLVVTEEFPRYRTGSFLILDQIQPDEDMEVEECYNAIGTAKLDFRNCLGYDHSYFDPWDYPSLRRRIKLC